MTSRHALHYWGESDEAAGISVISQTGNDVIAGVARWMKSDGREFEAHLKFFHVFLHYVLFIYFFHGLP